MLNKNVRIFVLSSKPILNRKKSSKTNKIKKMYAKKEKSKKQQHLQIKKLPDPIIYDPDKNQTNIQLVQHPNNSLRQHQQRTTKDAIEITTYYLELKKNIIKCINLYILKYYRIFTIFLGMILVFLGDLHIPHSKYVYQFN